MKNFWLIKTKIKNVVLVVVFTSNIKVCKTMQIIKLKWKKFLIATKIFAAVKIFLGLNLIYLIFDFLFIITNLWLCFYLRPEFKMLKEKYKGFRLLESYSNDEFYQWFDIEGFDLKYANIQPKYKLWYSLITSEIVFFFFNVIFGILYIIFLFFQICKYYEIITEKEKKRGKITKIVILITFIFFILNLINILLLMYFFIFTVFVLASKTFEDNIIIIVKMIALIIKNGFSFYHYYGLKNTIYFYMDLNYEVKTDNNNNARDNRNKNNIIKTGYLFINYNNIEVDVKANKNLYLEENNQSQNDQANKLYEFKQIRSNNISPDIDIYIKIKNNAYRNMLSITDWRYGFEAKPEKIYKKLDKLLIYIGLLNILLTPPLYFHAKDEEFYNRIREIIDNNIFKIYGDFEYAFSIIRYVIYIIICVVLLLLMLKRIFYGGYMIYKLLKYSNIICHSLNIYNLIIIILNILLIIFSIKCNKTQSDFFQKNNITNNYTKVFYIQHYYSYFCLVDIIFIIYKINSFRKGLVKLKNDIDNMCVTENEGTENEFQFKGLDSKNYILKEFIINRHPRYLYYNLSNLDNDINANTNINKNSNNNNIDANNNINEELFKKEDEINYENLDSKNNINMDDKKTNNE